MEDPENARVSIVDDFLGLWKRRFKFRLGAFHPWCLTISGALSLLVTLVFALAALDNVLLPHYEEIAYSVQTRCRIEAITNDPLIGERLKHLSVKFPLPGIPGLRDGEATCYESQSCVDFVPAQVVDCFFNTQDHSVLLSTALSGHDFIKLLSYIILVVPFFFASCFCLMFASKFWKSQWTNFWDWLTELWSDNCRWIWRRESAPPAREHRSYGADDPPSGQSVGQARVYDPAVVNRTQGYQQEAAGPAHETSIRLLPPPAVEQRRAPSPSRGGGYGSSNLSWVRMQMGV